MVYDIFFVSIEFKSHKKDFIKNWKSWVFTPNNDRQEKKNKVIDKLLEFFDKFFIIKHWNIQENIEINDYKC